MSKKDARYEEEIERLKSRLQRAEGVLREIIESKKYPKEYFDDDRPIMNIWMSSYNEAIDFCSKLASDYFGGERWRLNRVLFVGLFILILYG